MTKSKRLNISNKNKPKNKTKTKTKIKANTINTRKSKLNTNNNQKLLKINCNPNNDSVVSRDGTSCLRNSDIVLLVGEFNRFFPKYKIHITNNDDTTSIFTKLQKRIAQYSVCRREDCWLGIIDDGLMREKLLSELYGPYQPNTWNADPNRWLTNYDIEAVLKQYEDKYPDFKLIGPTSIDFNEQHTYLGGCVEEILCNFNYFRYIEKYPEINKLGIVINYDIHTGPGTHWAAIYIDLKEKLLFHFDSQFGYQGKLEPQIDDFIKIIKKQEPAFNVVINKKTHQYSTTECGMYVLYFLITMLTPNKHSKPKLRSKNNSYDKKIDYFTNKRVHDKDIIYLRDIYFNKDLSNSDKNIPL